MRVMCADSGHLNSCIGNEVEERLKYEPVWTCSDDASFLGGAEVEVGIGTVGACSIFSMP